MTTTGAWEGGVTSDTVLVSYGCGRDPGPRGCARRGRWTPFIFIIVLAGLQALPRDVTEAARIDGANWWQQVFLVKLPMIKLVQSTSSGHFAFPAELK